MSNSAKKVAHPIDVVCRNHQDGAYHCPQCDTPFSRRSNLRRHYQIHLRDAAFKCTNCNKDYTSKDELQDHLLICYPPTWNQPSFQGLENAVNPPPTSIATLSSPIDPLSHYSGYSLDGLQSYPSTSRMPSQYGTAPMGSYMGVQQQRGGGHQRVVSLPTMMHSPTSDLGSPISNLSSFDDPLASYQALPQHHHVQLHAQLQQHGSQSPFSHRRPGSSSSNASSSIPSPPYMLASSQMDGQHTQQNHPWPATTMSGYTVMPPLGSHEIPPIQGNSAQLDQSYPRQQMRDTLDNHSWFTPTYK